jgi:hypothetical protein
VLWAALGLASLYVTSSIAGTLEIAEREREVVFGVWHLLWGGAVLSMIPASGFLLQQTGDKLPRPRIADVLPFVLAAAVAYLLIADIRLDVRGDAIGFEVDHAIPEIFIPPLVVFLASAQLASGVSDNHWARRIWRAITIGASLLLLGLVLLTVLSVDARLDAPGTIASLVATAIYAVLAIAGGRFSWLIRRDVHSSP